MWGMTMTVQKVTFETDLIRPDTPGSWTYLRVPLDVEGIYGSKSRIPVQGTVDGSPFRSSLLPQGDGAFILVVNKELRDQINKQSGDTVTVIMERDTDVRIVEIPQDLADALEAHIVAQESFHAFAYSHQKEYVDWINSAKKAETRAARIEKAMGMLSGKKRLKG
jgi:hypothetical protein